MEKINKISIGYDSDNDILEVTIGQLAREAISIEQEDEVFIRIDPDTKEIVGMTILGFKKYLSESEQKGKKYHEFAVPIPG